MITSQLQAALTEEQKAALSTVDLHNVRWAVGPRMGEIQPGRAISHRLHDSVSLVLFSGTSIRLRHDLRHAVHQAAGALVEARDAH